MTSMPASRKARATTLAPRSCPSRPGLAMSTRMRCWAGPELIRYGSLSPSPPAPAARASGARRPAVFVGRRGLPLKRPFLLAGVGKPEEAVDRVWRDDATLEAAAAGAIEGDAWIAAARGDIAEDQVPGLRVADHTGHSRAVVG